METSNRMRSGFLLLVIVVILYGGSYQQFLHLKMADLRGVEDAKSYVEMSHGNYDVSPVHRFRPVIPYLASLIQRALRPLVALYRSVGTLPAATTEELDKLSFYLVNMVVATATALLLYSSLARLGFAWPLCLLGTIFFLTSRVVVEAVGTPLVDSLYYLAIAAISYLILSDRWVLLACLCPLLVLSKETTIPFLLLPFTLRGMRRWQLAVAVLLSLGALLVFRHMLQMPLGGPQPPPLAAIVIEHARSNVLHGLRRLATPAGIHDLLRGFSLLGILAPLGAIVNARSHKRRIPVFVPLMALIALGFALISGNLGRMFFAGYLPVIVYTLILIEHSGLVQDRS